MYFRSAEPSLHTRAEDKIISTMSIQVVCASMLTDTAQSLERQLYIRSGCIQARSYKVLNFLGAPSAFPSGLLSLRSLQLLLYFHVAVLCPWHCELRGSLSVGGQKKETRCNGYMLIKRVGLHFLYIYI